MCIINIRNKLRQIFPVNLNTHLKKKYLTLIFFYNIASKISTSVIRLYYKKKLKVASI